MPSATDWNRLLQALPEGTAERCDALLRRSLRRQLARSAAQGAEVPEAVRSEAVGQWRKRHAEGLSKSALRRMTYERLRDERSYRRIEAQILKRYRKRHEGEAHLRASDVGEMTFGEVCEAYRATRPHLAGSPLAGMGREMCAAAYRRLADPEDAYERMARRVCEMASSASLDGCAFVNDIDPGTPGRYRKRPFHLDDVTTEQEVADRVLATRLVDGMLAKAYRGHDAVTVATRLLAAQVRQDPDVRAVDALLAALFGGKGATDPMLERLARPDARSVASRLLGEGFAAIVASELLRNPLYGKQFERAVELQLRVRQNVPETPMDAYPLARTIRRHFVLHVGPTNSGKTHDALRELMAAPSGAYLGPLRLLAYEQYERMNREGCPCSLLTGEESSPVPGARHVASTVEMADFATPIDVAVIDEAQMIADADRGQHWTAAILGIPAACVHVCCASHAERVVRQLVELCGDEAEVVRHQRMVPLSAARGTFHLPESVEPGDALVVFSRKAVHAVAAEVAACGMKPSMIYGALPHDVRHEEARRFDAGETDVVVATDAIGMGMNLPIRRVVFVEQKKFDGHELRLLRPEEIQQIAGRAGRYGRYDEGFYQTTRRRKEIALRYRQPVPDITAIPVGIPRNIALVRDATLTASILQWASLPQPQPFQRVEVRRDLRLISEAEAGLGAERLTDIDTKLTVLALATMPFDEDDRTLHGAWLQMARAELSGDEAALDVPGVPGPGMRLIALEEAYRYCDLLHTYARTFGHDERLELLAERRAQISHAIMDILAQSGEAVDRPSMSEEVHADVSSDLAFAD